MPVRKDLLPRHFSLKGAVTMATVTMQSAMNPKHTDDFAGRIDSLPCPSLVTAPVLSAGFEWYRGRLPGF
ncbi:hypothetical protein [Hyalangium gracile]|uniref:hypothetical protein n=1 Tax=Hyalangium gracile TaxID=394092 RepID=UPI001CCD3ACF|nr:hypothetical protein [Hyalangium gracile]